MNVDRLDNPAWNSLNEIHRPLAIGNDEIKFYKPSICPFGGINSKQADLVSFFKKHPELSSFFIIGDKPRVPPGFTIEKELVCLQMVCTGPIKVEYKEDFVYLNNAFTKKLAALVNFVQPGYFEEGTSLMGDYFGIFKNDQLVAVTGERMKMVGFTEISAVVTHPDFTGQGFAKQLVAHTANKQFANNIIPYLHVDETNESAINLYEKLGFVTRRKIGFWRMKRTPE